MWSLIFLEILLVAINLIKIAAIVKPSKKCVPTYLTLSINVSTEKIVISTLLTGIYANRKKCWWYPFVCGYQLLKVCKQRFCTAENH